MKPSDRILTTRDRAARNLAVVTLNPPKNDLDLDLWSCRANSSEIFLKPSSGWPHNALRHHWLMPISCHFRDCKALLVTSLAHVSGAIASVQTFTKHAWLISTTSSTAWNLSGLSSITPSLRLLCISGVVVSSRQAVVISSTVFDLDCVFSNNYDLSYCRWSVERLHANS